MQKKNLHKHPFKINEIVRTVPLCFHLLGVGNDALEVDAIDAAVEEWLEQAGGVPVQSVENSEQEHGAQLSHSPALQRSAWPSQEKKKKKKLLDIPRSAWPNQDKKYCLKSHGQLGKVKKKREKKLF